ncbi:hypothetical protein M404DRAFT_69932, partial [Pisolithus tinctorius Marx 270]
DILPEPPVPALQPGASLCASQPQSSGLPHVILHVFDSIQTSFNKFGIAQAYHHRPSYDPDSFILLDELSNAYINPEQTDTIPASLPALPPQPWKNMSIWRLMTWMMSRSKQKSEAEVTRLINSVLRSDDFSIEDLDGFN